MKNTRPRPTVAALLGLCLLQVAHGAPPDPLEAELTPARIQARLAAVERSGLDKPAQEALKTALQEALAEVQRATKLNEQAKDSRAEASAAPTQLAAIRQELAGPPAQVRVEPPANATAAQLDQLVAKAEQDLSSAREQSEELRKEQAKRGERRAALDALLSTAQQALTAAEKGLTSAPGKGPLGEALRLAALAKRNTARAEIDALRAEVASTEARRELLPARIDLAVRHVTSAEQRVKAWQALAAERRRVEAQEATREAERLRLEAARRFPQVQALAQQNEALAQLRSGTPEQPGTATRLAEVARSLNALREALAALRERSTSVRAKVEAAGVTQPMGLLLRKELESLPQPAALQAQIDARSDVVADLQYQLIARADERSRAGDIERQVRERLAALGPEVTRDERADAERLLRELLTSRRDLLGALLADSERLFAQLVELDNATRQLLKLTEEQRAFLEERILWVRSVSGNAVPDPAQLAGALGWLTDGSSWGTGLRNAISNMAEHWLLVLLGAAAIGFILLSRLWARGRVRGMADVVERDAGDNFGYTVSAALIVLVRATAIPALLWGLGWALSAPSGQPPVVLSAAAGLNAAAFALFVFELLRQVLQPQGLGEVHFRWSGAVCAYVRWHLTWFIPVKFLTVFLVVTLDHQRQSDLWNDSLGRIAFVLGLIAFAVFNQRVLRPGSPVLTELKAWQPTGWLYRLRHGWLALAIGLPGLLALGALRGYYYTGVRLEARMQAWLWLLLALLLCDALFLRWLRVARRRLRQLEREALTAPAPTPGASKAELTPPTTETPAALDPPPTIPAAAATIPEPAATTAQAAATVPEARAALDAEAAREIAEESVPPPPQPSEPQRAAVATAAAAERVRALLGVELGAQEGRGLAIPEIDAQTRHLFRSAIVVVILLGTYLIWADVLPALRRLDQIQLYPELRFAPKTAVASALVVTLADLGLALVALAFTFVAARNVPGLLEIVLLRRLPLDAGSRYAAITLSRYTIVLLGVPFALSRVGITWDSVQWLAAALTFGLAFGLQEIFANFVSGLIILFERPIRVGDVVTVSGTSGVVTRIRMRATIVTDFDRKELIVPNKQFVTGEVLNWVLSDAVVRVVIPVGVGYTADVEEARRIMVRVAREHPLVLDQPPASCQLQKLGASTFDFELWAFVASLQDMGTVRHEVTREVHRALSLAGIDMPFPQQDVNLRQAPELPGHSST